MVIQYNKRDLPTALPVDVLNEKLNPLRVPHFEAVAFKGTGVEDTLKGISKLLFASLASFYAGADTPLPTVRMKASDVASGMVTAATAPAKAAPPAPVAARPAASEPRPKAPAVPAPAPPAPAPAPPPPKPLDPDATPPSGIARLRRPAPQPRTEEPLALGGDFFAEERPAPAPPAPAPVITAPPPPAPAPPAPTPVVARTSAPAPSSPLTSPGTSPRMARPVFTTPPADFVEDPDPVGIGLRTNEWVYLLDGKQRGPIDFEDLIDLILTSLPESTKVWRPGLPGWTAANAWPQIAAHIPPRCPTSGRRRTSRTSIPFPRCSATCSSPTRTRPSGSSWRCPSPPRASRSGRRSTAPRPGASRSSRGRGSSSRTATCRRWTGSSSAGACAPTP